MKNKPVVLFACSGLGRINRGYESFTLESYEALKDNDEFDSYLVKGGGETTDKSVVIPNLYRAGKPAILLARLFKKDSYFVEQFTFSILFLPFLIKKKPTVIYYSDFILGEFLRHLRRFFKFKYKLLFCNGAPNGPPFDMDHVQQLLPVYYNNAINQGVPASKQTLLPLGFDIDIDSRLTNIGQRDWIRNKLGFPADKKIILSVGAVNSHHKRMDYVINEVSKLPENYYLVILGQFEVETPALLSLAEQKLPGSYMITSVPLGEVEKYYIATDYFVLASLIEGFGRVLIEAQSYGLPCIVHESENAKEVLREYGTYINMKKDGALAACLLDEQISKDKALLIKDAYDNYSWDALKGRYLAMISKLF